MAPKVPHYLGDRPLKGRPTWSPWATFGSGRLTPDRLPSGVFDGGEQDLRPRNRRRSMQRRPAAWSAVPIHAPLQTTFVFLSPRRRLLFALPCA